MTYELKYKQYSERAILVAWPSRIDKNILEDVLLFKNSIKIKKDKVIVQITSTYNSLLIFYTSTIKDVYSEISALRSIYETCGVAENLQNHLWEIPVCYEDELSPDLLSFCNQKKLSVDEFVALHTAPTYQVYFIGFLPGFLYLGGLDPKLHFPRKQTPNLKVEKGSVAIGGQQTGIYPSNSPGGWHVVGKTPVELFDKDRRPPCFIQPGDQIKYVAISLEQYGDIFTKIKKGTYDLKSVKL
ncbi:5-oxoprolinase subunit PxpB [Aquimarina brevivitae]|uniref:Inhibitor of KinA n=1 Tax=Aquimarina brevivitae TaxID=323412 RepID=A0A4Q7NYH0_9FLAO|nr:5-oxoprolinase subunit PxpB [Aquimarina brevivitae]RZS92491.1 inhibitor of KinA [Aquimarina brevivitae]